GDPKQRFEEDPVRMLRTLRFAAKLNFDIDPQILKIFDVDMTQLLRDVSPHRLYDESQKLFTMGHLARVLPMLIEFDIWKQLFADIKPDISKFIERAAKNTDQRIQIGKTINPAFFYAVLLWKPFLERCDFYLAKGIVPAEARAQAGLDVLKRQATRTVIPRFAETFIREVWEMQVRLLNPKPQQIEALASHARFRAGFDFLLLREKSGDDSTQGMGQWWDHYQSLSSDEKETAISQYNRQRAKTRRKQNIEANESKDTTAEIEPLVNVPEARSRRARREQTRSKDHVARSPESSTANLNTDHPIMKRKRVQRDLSQVVFGPTQ
ncbi:MAG TPA: polynucleotide adenylyltransferase PcnB, partial [Acinetobacter ursingii]|nr:polynucleotide adenylyltransferase PcnB [Acinetobacter ursingii]